MESRLLFLDNDNHWRIDSPDGLPVGLDRWGGVTLLLSGPKTRRELVDAQPTDLEQYGLASPSSRIDIDLKDGRTINVLMGFPTPDQVGFYGQVEGFPQVYTIVKSWKDVHTRLIYEPPYPEWYYKINTSSLQDVELETPDGKAELSIGEEGWHLNDEEMTPIDQELADEFLASLEQPTQSLAAYGPVNLAEYGLDEPSLTLLLRTIEVSQEGVEVHIPQPSCASGTPRRTAPFTTAQAEREEIIQDIFSVNADWIHRIQAVVAQLPLSDTAAQGG